MIANGAKCPVCGFSLGQPFFQMQEVPVHQNLLMPSREAARQCDRGDIQLAFCQACGFITNLAFEPGRLNYSTDYENSQAYSPVFQAYLEQLAQDLIGRYGLHHKAIVEIGCGKGEFLKLLCQFGPNRGIGFDPSYVPNGSAPEQITFIQDFYSEQYTDIQADFVCCRHVIEHIQQPGELVARVRQSLEDQSHPVVFFEMPNVSWILHNLTFWDIFYEHCSYFSVESLSQLFARNYFDVLRVTEAFGGQYLWLEARSRSKTSPVQKTNQETLPALSEAVAYFARHYQEKMAVWRNKILDYQTSNHSRAVIWGAGAKGVTVLNALAVPLDSIEFVVDINPRKQGKYIPGTGQQIVAPHFLKDYAPDTIFVMNPNYLPEIQSIAATMALRAQLVPL